MNLVNGSQSVIDLVQNIWPLIIRTFRYRHPRKTTRDVWIYISCDNEPHDLAWHLDDNSQEI